jgi:hypothetical protein
MVPMMADQMAFLKVVKKVASMEVMTVEQKGGQMA